MVQTAVTQVVRTLNTVHQRLGLQRSPAVYSITDSVWNLTFGGCASASVFDRLEAKPPKAIPQAEPVNQSM
ncbi:MAG: hypothetical protein ACFBSF_02210 [Leptolyngbyaceae cyanobacterium]